MSIQLDLTTATRCQNFDSAQGYITLQDHRVIDVDQNIAKIFGYDTREALLNNVDFVYSLIPKHYRGSVRERYLSAIKGKLQNGKIYTDVPVKGNFLSLFSLAQCIMVNNRPALRVMLIDITSVIAAERRHKEKDQMYRALLNSSKQGVLVHRNFKPLMVNQAWVEMLGAKSIEEVLAMDSIISIIPPDNRTNAMRRCQSILAGDTPSFSSVVENQCFDGSKKHFNIYDNIINWEGEKAIQVVVEDVSDKVILEQELMHRALHDDLTQVFNRSAIYDWLKKPLKEQTEMSCLLLDIDDFKKINDQFGHSVGDDVIRTLANTIKKHVKALNGVVGRWGGEEFIVFFPKKQTTHATALDTADSQARVVGERICEEFRTHQFLGFNRTKFQSSVSIGITDSCILRTSNSLNTLIRVTDDALYRAKSNGKNRVSVNHEGACVECCS
ncbi:diguanylate cyclase [Vibrio pomeroyi]|uniref:diguanylate cyclase n=1 Tax=Vibrio pomeroyi TaxID=198832 RepID=A0ABV4N1G4_9VIBR|nr:sensor domain-containing diguanylate cyclase [Vibrio sp. ED004]UPR56659.1 sensor domain-containing diguanylate cyclase [Vibrio sp. ED004]